MYRAGPTEQELRLLGVSSIEELGGEPPVEVWEENMRAVNVFLSLGTQWRYTMGTASGLDYNAVKITMDLMGVDEDERSDTFIRIMIMEREALRVMGEQAKNR